MAAVCIFTFYLQQESPRVRRRTGPRPPLSDRPRSAWPSSPTLNSSPRNQRDQCLETHSPHLSPPASVEGWEWTEVRISPSLCYNLVSHGPCLVQERS